MPWTLTNTRGFDHHPQGDHSEERQAKIIMDNYPKANNVSRQGSELRQVMKRTYVASKVSRKCSNIVQWHSSLQEDLLLRLSYDIHLLVSRRLASVVILDSVFLSL